MFAHPLGNFVINHYASIEVGSSTINIHYIVDMAEIAALPELQTIPKNSTGSRSTKELSPYRDRIATQYAQGINLKVDDISIPLQVVSKFITLPPGAGNLPTIFMICDFQGALPANTLNNLTAVHHLSFVDNNHAGRIGWHEIMVSASEGITIFNSSAFGNDVTDGLTTYPENLTSQPLAERTAELAFIKGVVPPNSQPLQLRSQATNLVSRDKFVELIATPQLSWAVILIGLLVAACLGGLHALSPGHGKTIVGAYLVGSHSTVWHAIFLGLTVTITHTLGVFLLGLVTLSATQYILPERLFPFLSLISGLMVLVIGLSLIISRIRAARTSSSNIKEPTIMAVEQAEHNHTETFTGTHSHGGVAHSHLPPSGDNVTWRSLLTLGISGGLLPCPSALVVLLAAISHHRIAYGLLLVLAFSTGLATVLTVIGLIFLYARRFIKVSARESRVTLWLPVISALIITLAGAAICWEAFKQSRSMFNW